MSRLFPIIVPNKHLFAAFLTARGVGAYRGATQLCYVKPNPGYKDCEYSQWFMDHVMYLPMHPSVGDKDSSDMINKVILAYKDLMRYLKEPHNPQATEDRTIQLFERAKL